MLGCPRLKAIPSSTRPLQQQQFGLRLHGCSPLITPGTRTVLAAAVAAPSQSASKVLSIQKAKRGLDQQLSLVNSLKPLTLDEPPILNLLHLVQAADRDRKALRADSLRKIQEFTVDALNKLQKPEKASSLNPVLMAALLETVATLKVLNERLNRSPAETTLLVVQMKQLLAAAGEKVYNSAKPRTLLDILQAHVVLEIPGGMDRRARQLDSALMNERWFLEKCTADVLVMVLNFLEPIAAEISQQTARQLVAAFDRVVRSLPSTKAKDSSSQNTKAPTLSFTELAFLIRFFASLPQVSLRPEPAWLLQKAELAMSCLSDSKADPGSLVLASVSLLAADSPLLSSEAHMQQGIRLATRLLCLSRASPLASPSAPALVARLAQLLNGRTAGAARQAVDPKLPSSIATFLSQNTSELAQPAVLLLISLAAQPLPAARQWQPLPRDRSQPPQPDSLHAAAAAAASKLLKAWESGRLPSDHNLLVLLPSLAKTAGTPLLAPRLQRSMEDALITLATTKPSQPYTSKTRPYEVEVFEKVVMPIAEAGGHCLVPQTLDVSLPALAHLQLIPPSRLAILIGSFSMAGWSPKSLMRTRLLVAVFRSLPRCSPVELQQLVTAAGRVVQRPAAPTPFPRMRGLNYDSVGSIQEPSAAEWSAQIESCLNLLQAMATQLAPDARAALLHSLYYDMGGRLPDDCLYQIMQPMVHSMHQSSPEALAQLAEVVAAVRKAPASHAWPLAVIKAAASALAAGDLSGHALGRFVACLPTFADQHPMLGVIPPVPMPAAVQAAMPAPAPAVPAPAAEPPTSAAPAPASSPPTPTPAARAASASAPPLPQQAARMPAPHSLPPEPLPPSPMPEPRLLSNPQPGLPPASVSVEVEAEAASQGPEASPTPPAVLEVGTLVEARVTAVRLYWLELELCSLAGGEASMGFSSSSPGGSSPSSGGGSSRRSRRREKRAGGGDSSSSSGMPRTAVAGMKARMHVSHVSAAPVDNLADLFLPGAMVKAVVMPQLKEHASVRAVSLSTSALEPELGALLRVGPAAVYDMAEEVWASRQASGQAILRRWSSSSSSSSSSSVSVGGNSLQEGGFPGYEVAPPRKEGLPAASALRQQLQTPEADAAQEGPAGAGPAAAVTAAGVVSSARSPEAMRRPEPATMDELLVDKEASPVPEEASPAAEDALPAGAATPHAHPEPEPSPEPSPAAAAAAAAVPAAVAFTAVTPAAAQPAVRADTLLPAEPAPATPRATQATSDAAGCSSSSSSSSRSPSPTPVGLHAAALPHEGAEAHSHDHAALLEQCRRFVRPAAAALLQQANLEQVVEQPDLLAGAAIALAACGLRPVGGWIKEYEAVSQGLLPSMSCTVLCRLLWSMARLGHHPSWLWVAIAADALGPHLGTTLAKDHPRDLALGLAGLHTQLARADSVAALMAAVPSNSSSGGRSSGSGSSGGSGRVEQGAALQAARHSLYCTSHLQRLPPQATAVARVALRAGAVWLEASSRPTHKQHTLEVLPDAVLEACVRAMAAMNTPAADPLSPMIMQLGTLPTHEQRWWPPAGSLGGGARWQPPPPALQASRSLVPGSVWLQLVGQQLCVLLQQQVQQQGPGLGQQGDGKQAMRSLRPKQLQLVREQHAHFEDTLSALLALQTQVHGVDSITAVNMYLRIASANLSKLLPEPGAVEQEQLVAQSLRASTLIRAAKNAVNRVPAPYVQRFLALVIKQGLMTAAAGMELAATTQHGLAASTADSTLPDLADHLAASAADLQRKQPEEAAELLAPLQRVLATVQLCACPAQDTQQMGVHAWHGYRPPPGFVQAVVAFLSTCCAVCVHGHGHGTGYAEPGSAAGGGSSGCLDQAAGLDQAAAALIPGFHTHHHLVSCVFIISDWLEAEQERSTPDLGLSSLKRTRGCGLSLLLDAAPAIAPMLRAALRRMQEGLQQQQQGVRDSSGLGPAEWFQALWVSNVLAQLDSQLPRHSSSSDSSNGNNGSSDSSGGDSSSGHPALDAGAGAGAGAATAAAAAQPYLSLSSSTHWDLLIPSALAAHSSTNPTMTAITCSRLALVLEDHCEAIWREIRGNDDPSARMHAARTFGAAMPSAGWANTLAQVVGGNSFVLDALDSRMLGQVASGLCAVGMGSRHPQATGALPYLPCYLWRVMEDVCEDGSVAGTMKQAAEYAPHLAGPALTSIVGRLWRPDVHALPLRQDINRCQLLMVAYGAYAARADDPDFLAFSLMELGVELKADKIKVKPQPAGEGDGEGGDGCGSGAGAFWVETLPAIINSTIEASTHGQLHPQQAFPVLDLMFFMHKHELTKDLLTKGTQSTLVDRGWGWSPGAVAAVQALLPVVMEGFVMVHEGTEAFAVTLLLHLHVLCKAQHSTRLAQDLLSLLDRPQPLPLTTVQLLLDFCFGDFNVRPWHEAQALERAVPDAAVARLLQRALDEASRLESEHTRCSCRLSIASLCGITKSPPYDLAQPAPFMELRPGVSSQHVMSLIHAIATDIRAVPSFIDLDDTTHALRLISLMTPSLLEKIQSEEYWLIMLRSVPYEFLDASKDFSEQAAWAFMSAMLTCVGLHGDKALLKVEDRCFAACLAIAAHTEDAALYFKALELMYSMHTRLPLDRMVVVATGGLVARGPLYEQSAFSHETWAYYVEDMRFAPSGVMIKADKARLQSVVARGLQMLDKHQARSPAPSGTHGHALLPIYPGEVGSRGSSSSTDMDEDSFASLKQEFWEQQCIREEAPAQTPEETLVFSCMGGILDGGPYAHKHKQVWQAALLYGLATHQQPAKGVGRAMLRKARDRFVEVADAACAGADSPVRVEEVVVWLGPCLGGISILEEPKALPEELPFRRWLEAADWSGLFRLPESLDLSSKDGLGAHAVQGAPPPVLPPYKAKLSPHTLAAIQGGMDHRWLLQLQSAWGLCPDFKLLFWEVLSHKAGWQLGLPPATTAPLLNPLQRLMGVQTATEGQNAELTARAIAAAAAAATAARNAGSTAPVVVDGSAYLASVTKTDPGAVVVEPLLSLLVFHWPGWEEMVAEIVGSNVQPQNMLQAMGSGMLGKHRGQEEQQSAEGQAQQLGGLQVDMQQGELQLDAQLQLGGPHGQHQQQEDKPESNQQELQSFELFRSMNTNETAWWRHVRFMSSLKTNFLGNNQKKNGDRSDHPKSVFFFFAALASRCFLQGDQAATSEEQYPRLTEIPEMKLLRDLERQLEKLQQEPHPRVWGIGDNLKTGLDLKEKKDKQGFGKRKGQDRTGKSAGSRRKRK